MMSRQRVSVRLSPRWSATTWSAMSFVTPLRRSSSRDLGQHILTGLAPERTSLLREPYLFWRGGCARSRRSHAAARARAGSRPAPSAIEVSTPPSTSARTVATCSGPPSPSITASSSAVQPSRLTWSLSMPASQQPPADLRVAALGGADQPGAVERVLRVHVRAVGQRQLEQLACPARPRSSRSGRRSAASHPSTLTSAPSAISVARGRDVVGVGRVEQPAVDVRRAVAALITAARQRQRREHGSSAAHPLSSRSAGSPAARR